MKVPSAAAKKKLSAIIEAEAAGSTQGESKSGGEEDEGEYIWEVVIGASVYEIWIHISGNSRAGDSSTPPKKRGRARTQK